MSQDLHTYVSADFWEMNLTGAGRGFLLHEGFRTFVDCFMDLTSGTKRLSGGR
jgi:hypothetical protein